MPPVEFTPEQKNIIDVFKNTKKNVWIYGPAATGKSTIATELERYCIDDLEYAGL